MQDECMAVLEDGDLANGHAGQRAERCGRFGQGSGRAEDDQQNERRITDRLRHVLSWSAPFVPMALTIAVRQGSKQLCAVLCEKRERRANNMMHRETLCPCQRFASPPSPASFP